MASTATEATASQPPAAVKPIYRISGFLFAGALLAISATMNWRFGHSLSTDVLEQQLFGLASLAVDGLKAVLPLFIIFLWRAGHRFMTLVAFVLWALCFSWSMASAIGFSAKSREEATAGRSKQIETRQSLVERERELKAQLAALPTHRSAAVVRTELQTVDVPVAVWRRTNGCTDFTREDSRRICASALALKRELAAAETAERLAGEALAVRERLGAGETVAVADPQVYTLARVIDVPAETVKIGLALLLATLVELASAIGFTVVALATSRDTMLRIEARTATVLARERRRTERARGKLASDMAREPVALAAANANGHAQVRAAPPTAVRPGADAGAMGNGMSTASDLNGASGRLGQPKRQVEGGLALPKQNW